MKSLTPKEMEWQAVTRGWYFVRMNGSHAQYRHPAIPGVLTIPFHGSRTLPVGTQRAIMRRIGITPDDL